MKVNKSQMGLFCFGNLSFKLSLFATLLKAAGNPYFKPSAISVGESFHQLLLPLRVCVGSLQRLQPLN